jgi:transcriptional regulator with XRE-family HTH domain
MKNEVKAILKSKIGPLIKRLRSEKCWTARELSLRSEVSEATINAVEREDRLPSLAVVGCICVALGIDMTTFFKEAQKKD